MITRFFKTSKPIHFVILMTYVVIMFLVSRIKVAPQVNFMFLASQIPIVLVLIATLFLLDFFIRKNDLTLKNNYKILIYALFLVAFPIVFQNNDVLLANLFIFLALRRVLSLRSQKSIKKKLFDTAFWIGVATLFYFWSILYFLLIPLALILYGVSKLKHWIIPFVGFITVFILITTYHIILGDTFDVLYDYIKPYSLDFTNYNNVALITAITIVTSLGLWTLLLYIINLKEKTRAIRPSHILVIIAMFIGVAIIVVSPNKNGTELIFGLAPLTIIIVNYVERIQSIWISEVIFWILILLPQTALIG